MLRLAHGKPDWRLPGRRCDAVNELSELFKWIRLQARETGIHVDWLF
jgi:hypothetical protein